MLGTKVMFPHLCTHGLQYFVCLSVSNLSLPLQASKKLISDTIGFMATKALNTNVAIIPETTAFQRYSVKTSKKANVLSDLSRAPLLSACLMLVFSTYLSLIYPWKWWTGKYVSQDS